jgi:hypothetical protein
VEEHVAAVRRWCESAWGAWAEHRERIRSLSKRVAG